MSAFRHGRRADPQSLMLELGARPSAVQCYSSLVQVRMSIVIVTMTTGCQLSNTFVSCPITQEAVSVVYTVSAYDDKWQ